MHHVKIGTEGTQAIHVSTLMGSLGANAKLRDLVYTTGGAVVRNQLFVRFAGEGASLALNGATLIKARQHVDKALKTLAAGLDDDDARVRMAAATALLDRGFGKPAQAIIGGGPEDAPIQEEKVVRYVGNPVSGET